MTAPDGKMRLTDCANTETMFRKAAARKGREVAGTARKDLEKKTGKRVVSSGNYLDEPESRKRLKP